MIVLCMTVEQEPETGTRIGGDGFWLELPFVEDGLISKNASKIDN